MSFSSTFYYRIDFDSRLELAIEADYVEFASQHVVFYQDEKWSSRNDEKIQPRRVIRAIRADQVYELREVTNE